jgi:hypothetical protein
VSVLGLAMVQEAELRIVIRALATHGTDAQHED